MALGADEFYTALASDVRSLYQKGLNPAIEPYAIPAVAELAEALAETGCDGSDAYYGEVVANLLRTAINRWTYGQRQRGLTDLFGIGELRVLGLVDRCNRAGKDLGYPNGYDGIRKAEQDGREIKDIICDDITDWLIAIAEEQGIVYEGRFIRPVRRAERPHRAAPLLVSASQGHSNYAQDGYMTHHLVTNMASHTDAFARQMFDSANEHASLITTMPPSILPAAEVIWD